MVTQSHQPPPYPQQPQQSYQGQQPYYPGHPQPVYVAALKQGISGGKVALIVLGAVAMTFVGTCTAISLLLGGAASAVAEAGKQHETTQAEATVQLEADVAAATPAETASGPAVEKGKPEAEPVVDAKAEEPPRPTAAWITDERTDSMSGRITKFASLSSSNSHSFGWPYEGQTRARMLLRTEGKSRDVIVSIDQGQIICHSFTNCRVEVRFDDAPPEKYRGSESADNDSTVVFLSPASKFMAKAAKAKKIKIALVIYQEGVRIFEFETQAAPSAVEPSSAESTGRVGVQACDEYIEKYEKCISTKVPEAARAQMMEAMDQSAEAWAEAARGPARDGLAKACAAAIKAARDATASMGCDF